MVQDVLISIFIPVFNGEKYLEETLLSIQKQTYKNIEVLLVDDASTDGSLNILHRFSEEDARFVVYSKANGGMVAKSWNFILPKIKGAFIFYASQDDLFSIDLIEKMVQRQKETNADSILPDMEFYHQKEKENPRIVGLNNDRTILLKGREACIASLSWNIHGFTLSSKKTYDDEIFPEDAFDSDEFMTRKILFKSNTVAFCDGIFYYRQDNLEAITKNVSKKNFYTLNTLKRMYDFLEENKFDKKYVIRQQFDLYRKYILYSSLFNTFHFKSNVDKDEIRTFLIDFKEKYLSNDAIYTNLKFARGGFYFKFGILWLLYKINVLNKLYVKIETFRLKLNPHKQ
jgi:glycosyltransferase involved in cell wall biosynthesis